MSAGDCRRPADCGILDGMWKTIGLVSALLLAASCKPGGVAGVASDYADAVCDCKTKECLTEVQTRFGSKLSELEKPKDSAEVEAAAKQMGRAAECMKKLALGSLLGK